MQKQLPANNDYSIGSKTDTVFRAASLALSLQVATAPGALLSFKAGVPQSLLPIWHKH